MSNIKTRAYFFTKGTSLEYKKDAILESICLDSFVNIGINNSSSKYGKFIFLDDADELLNKDMVRYVSHLNLEDFLSNPTRRVNLTKVLMLKFIDTIQIYE